MGRKYIGTGKHLYFCITFLICFVLFGYVVPAENAGAQTPSKDVTRWRLLKADDSQEYKQDTSSSEKVLSNDEELFNTGMSYADPGNPAKDFNKSIATFKKLIAEHSQGAWAYRSHVVSEILQENARLRKLSGDLQLENAKLRKQHTDLQQENTKLKDIIEQSKKVDIEIEKKKRE